MAVLALDIGGVVYRSWPDDAFNRRWGEALGCPAERVADLIWGGSHWAQAELGQMTSEECYARAAARAGVAPDLARAIAFEAFASRPDEALAIYVAGVRSRGARVAALTNNVAREPELLARPELARLFDLAISSADVGMAKPDAAIFRHAEARLGVRPEEIVFADDVALNVEAARALGWRAVHFKSTPQAIGEIEAALDTI
jgi:epoxide hydrolase-like predicted phosphatase